MDPTAAVAAISDTGLAAYLGTLAADTPHTVPLSVEISNTVDGNWGNINSTVSEGSKYVILISLAAPPQGTQ
jgi:hypothetical protein